MNHEVPATDVLRSTQAAELFDIATQWVRSDASWLHLSWRRHFAQAEV